MGNTEEKRLSFIIKKLEDRIDKRIADIKLFHEDQAQKRKINVRGEYNTKLRLFARKQYAKHLAKKEASLLEKKPNSEDYNPVTGESKEYDSQIKETQLAKDMNLKKIQEHEARLEEIQRIKAENEVAKAEEQLAKAQEQLNNHPYAAMAPIDTEEVSPAVPVIESALISAQNKVVEPINTQVPAEEKVEEELPPVAVEPLSNEERVEVPVHVEEPTVESEPSEVDKLLSSFGKSGETLSADMNKIMEAITVAIRNYSTDVQKKSVDALNAKQTENDELTADNKAKDEEIAKLTAENTSKDSAIADLTVEGANKDREIEMLQASNVEKSAQIAAHEASIAERDSIIAQKDSQITEKDAIIEQRNAQIAAMSVQIETMQKQFEDIRVMMSNFQTQMQEVQQQEDVKAPYQKAN